MSEWCSVCKDRPRIAGSKVCGQSNCDEKYMEGSKHLALGCLTIWGLCAGIVAFFLGFIARGCTN